MKRETYLLELAIFFFTGNFLCRQIIEWFGASQGFSASIAAISYLFLMILIPWGCKRDLTRFIIFFFIGSMSYSVYDYFNSYDTYNITDGGTFLINGTAEKCGRSKSGKKFVEVGLTRGKTIIYNIPENVSIRPGDSISAEITAHKVTNFTPDFDYVKYMKDRKIDFTCFLTKKREMYIRNNPRPKIRHIAARLQISYIEYIQKNLEGRCSDGTIALAVALSCGNKSLIDKNIYENFRKSGSLHLLALSGLHLGIIYAILSFLLSFSGNYPCVKKIRSCLTIILLWAYSIFTGLGVSILRAVIMITIYETASIFNKEKNGMNALAVSILAIGLFSPADPGSISFLLSAGAMFGIFFLYPTISGSLTTDNKFLKNIFNIIAMSTACQIITTPIILKNFGTFPALSIIANIFCSPLVTLIMSIIPITLVLSYIFPSACGISATILNILAEVLIKLNEIIANSNLL